LQASIPSQETGGPWAARTPNSAARPNAKCTMRWNEHNPLRWILQLGLIDQFFTSEAVRSDRTATPVAAGSQSRPP
jgi:hypothetical protein